MPIKGYSPNANSAPGQKDWVQMEIELGRKLTGGERTVYRQQAGKRGKRAPSKGKDWVQQEIDLGRKLTAGEMRTYKQEHGLTMAGLSRDAKKAAPQKKASAQKKAPKPGAPVTQRKQRRGGELKTLSAPSPTMAPPTRTERGRVNGTSPKPKKKARKKTHAKRRGASVKITDPLKAFMKFL
jgi:hypothetical protein